MAGSAVVDTNILVHAAGAETDENNFFHSLYIIVHLMEDETFSLAIDEDHEILEEYQRNLDQLDTRYSNSIQEFIQKQVYQTPGEERVSVVIPLPESQVEDLVNMGFDTSDLIFVRIAPNTDMETIASADGRSFLDNDYKDWIEANLGVDVLNTLEFKELLNHIS